MVSVPDPLLLGALVVPMLLFYLSAVFLRDLLHAVIAFAGGSALLAAIFALLGAPFAAVLELTVGAGLIAVLFLVAITLTQGSEEEVAHG